jgi:hypothetical protein
VSQVSHQVSLVWQASRCAGYGSLADPLASAWEAG